LHSNRVGHSQLGHDAKRLAFAEFWTFPIGARCQKTCICRVLDIPNWDTMPKGHLFLRNYKFSQKGGKMLTRKKPDQPRTVDKSADLVESENDSSILAPSVKRKRSLCDAVLDMESEMSKLQCVGAKIGALLQKHSPDVVRNTMTPNFTRDLIDASNQLNTSITQINQQIGFIATSILDKDLSEAELRAKQAKLAEEAEEAAAEAERVRVKQRADAELRAKQAKEAEAEAERVRAKQRAEEAAAEAERVRVKQRAEAELRAKQAKEAAAEAMTWSIQQQRLALQQQQAAKEAKEAEAEAVFVGKTWADLNFQQRVAFQQQQKLQWDVLQRQHIQQQQQQQQQQQDLLKSSNLRRCACSQTADSMVDLT